MLFTQTIKNNKIFTALFKKGKFTSCGFIVVYYRTNNLPFNRLGITTGKKVGNAVERNRARRIIRAGYRISEAELPIGFDIVIVARADIRGRKSTDIEKFLKTRLNKELLKAIGKSAEK